ncbi:hypothetical protein D915_005466 [Fasciola hepatica]|uniref:PDZ domain-containing protein n=1 Tax=Fasciola hepatica TaxID=6192 RepID=A0A4E0RSB9_FASHE|nr:hypothetical protein D915_005466 [Fasciola hepatica]
MNVSNQNVCSLVKNTMKLLMKLYWIVNPGNRLGLHWWKNLYHLDYIQMPGGNCSGIFIKYLAPGGLAEQSGQVRVNDQLLTVNSVSVLACDSSNLHTDGRVQLDLWQSCPGQSDCQSSLRSGHVSANWATLVAHNTDMKSRSNTIDTGTLMYPFAVRLLRQAIGPIRLGMRRIANVHSSSHVNNTEQTLVDLEPETSELLAITSIGDDTGMSQSGIRNMSKNGECGSSNFGDLSLVPGQNQMPEKAPSPEQSLTSTRPTLSPLEIPHDPKPPASVLIDEEDSPTTQGQVVEMVVQEPITVTKLPLRYSPRMARKAQMTHVTDTERLLSLSSINTPQSIEGPEQIKIQLSNPKPSPPQIPTRGTGNLQRRCRTVRLEHNRFSKQKYTAVVIPPVLQAEPIPIPPKPRSRHLFTAQLTKPEATITSVPQPPPRLSSASLSIPVGKPSFGKRYSTCKRVESLPRVKRHHTSTPKAHTEWPPSSGDHSHSHRVHHGHMVSVRTSPPRRQCKMSEQSNRHHIAHTDHRCVNKSSVTAPNKSSGRLDSRLAALAKHIPQSTDCPTSHGPQPTTIDADDSQQFQELIANLTETEWQALLHMISQPDESYQSPKMRNRQEKLPGLAMRQRMKFNHWSREGVQPNKQMERGDGHRKDLRHGVHANRQKTSRVTENRTPACHNEIR